MPETPLPQTLSDDYENPLGSAAESRTRKRPNAPGRPVSAFAPAHPKSDPPATTPSPTTMQLTPDDCSFVAALRSAGLAAELDGPELARAARGVHAPLRRARHLDLLGSYYAAAGDPLVSRRRQAMDRWFSYSAREGLHVTQLLPRILNVLPEIYGARIERVGGASGALVVRAGEHVCALEDEQEDGAEATTVSVSGLVRALNILLDRQGVRARLIGLFGDGERETYLGIPSMAAAVPLAQADYLTAVDAEALMELTGW
jgi:hypothetical protein